jgi:hypothetical protein
LKGKRITLPKEVRQNEYKMGAFVDFLVTIYRSIKIIKIKFDWKKAMKQIDSLRKQKLLQRV